MSEPEPPRDEQGSRCLRYRRPPCTESSTFVCGPQSLGLSICPSTAFPRCSRRPRLPQGRCRSATRQVMVHAGGRHAGEVPSIRHLMLAALFNSGQGRLAPGLIIARPQRFVERSVCLDVWVQVVMDLSPSSHRELGCPGPLSHM